MKYIIIIACLFISACSTTQEQKQVVTIYEKQRVIKAEKINPLYLEDIEFSTAEINKESYIIISSENYKKLIINMEKIKKYMKEQKDIINYYESEIIF